MPLPPNLNPPPFFYSKRSARFGQGYKFPTYKLQDFGKYAPFVDDNGHTIPSRVGSGTDRAVQPGRCLSFDGATQYITTSSLSSLGIRNSDGTAGAFTLSGWFKITDFAAARRLFGSSVVALNFEISGGTVIAGFYTSISDYITGTASTTVVVAGEWTHISISHDGSNTSSGFEIFINGISQTVTPGSGGSYTTMANDDLWLGRWAFDGYHKGQMYGLTCHQRVLTPTEITAIYRQGREPWHVVPGQPTDAVGQWLLDDNSATLSRNSGSLLSAADGTIIGSAPTYEGSDVPYSAQNLIGYSDGPAGTFTPLQQADPTLDVLGNPAEYTGIAPRDAEAVESPCGTFDGSLYYLAVPNLVGDETVISSGGTATPTVSAGRIDFTAGTCWDLLLSNGSLYPFSEKVRDDIYDVVNGNHATAAGIAEPTFWGTTQDSFHWDLTKGFTDNGGVHVPALANGTADAEGNPIGNPAGVGLNTTYTNIDADPEPDAPWLDSSAGGAEFNGVDSYIAADIGTPVYPFELSCEYENSAPGQNSGLVSVASSSVSTDYFNLGTSGVNLSVARRNSTVNESSVIANSADTGGVQTARVVFHNATDFSVYHNGQLIEDRSELAVNIEAPHNQFLIGSIRSTTILSPFTGTIKNAALTVDGTTVAALPLLGSAADVSGNNNNGTENGALVWPVVGTTINSNTTDGTTPLQKDKPRIDPPHYSTITTKLDHTYGTKI